ncbi:sugar phosphate isomerase/epimerase family protein [Brevibacterium yomogidense]|uniref:sugar phosphate isomerase/epimerase family protein n=1 Tax=Brevibacterium yomogidense TaxID=946573 RepID=UPI0018E04BB2|nr:sugar phosphate isomerase/epimerase [Brevibacterium yomogidense]
MAEKKRLPLTSPNSARAKAKRQREELARSPVYEPKADYRSAHEIRIGLSTSSVYPMTVRECFETAARLGYDGVEVMITNNEETQDPGLMSRFARATGLPVLSVHAPTLLLMPRVMHRDHWEKLRRTAELAKEAGARTVVLHPPFRWQGDYAKNFVEGVRAMSEETGVTLAVENMYPWRAGVREVLVYSPHWDLLGQDYDAVTFDFSHASTAGTDALEAVRTLFPALRHVHLTDGMGTLTDEHLVPGRGRMPVAETLQYLAKHDWSGDVVVEVNTRFTARRSTRDAMLTESLEFARRHLGLDS